MLRYCPFREAPALRFQTPRGTRDILPGEIETWQRVEALVREVFPLYGFREIRTPIFEATELFARGVGSSTDIVRKEMFTFASGDDSLTLRPEMTASVVRAYIQHGLARSPGAERLFYIGPMFRHERPQKGRQRQFHQIGVEAIGSDDPYVDAETIEMVMSFLARLNIGGISLVVNSVGCAACRPLYRDALRRWVEAHAGANALTGPAGVKPQPSPGQGPAEEEPVGGIADADDAENDDAPGATPRPAPAGPRGPAEAGPPTTSTASRALIPGEARRNALCDDCQRRLVENPLRLFDCKVEKDRAFMAAAPTVLEHLCAACREHFEALQEHLGRLGITYRIDPRLVRGLDYYVRTAFEIVAASGLGAQNALMGGGRYDGLMKELGGADLPGFGWALGLERLMMLLGVPGAEGDPASIRASADLFIAHLGEQGRSRALGLARDLRARGVSVRLDPRPSRLGSQLKRADREGARFALILGDDEIEKGAYQLKDMKTETQEPIAARNPDGLLEALVQRMRPSS